jgi:uncharacterized membrane protein
MRPAADASRGGRDTNQAVLGGSRPATFGPPRRSLGSATQLQPVAGSVGPVAGCAGTLKGDAMIQRRASAVIGVTGSVVVLALLGPAGPAQAQRQSQSATNRCAPTITALPLPAGETNGDVLSVRGSIAVGYAADDSQHQTVMVWRRHTGTWTVQDLGNFGITEQFSGLSATGVNTRGDVTIGVNTNVMGAWFYRDGVTHPLVDFAGGTNAFVRAINDDGEMVGEALDADGNDFGAVWMHWWSKPTKLRPTAGYDGSYAQGVNDEGDVVGGSFSYGPNPTLPVRWSPEGSVKVLDTVGSDAQGADINSAGRAVGDGATAAGDGRALVWDRAGQVRDLGVFPGSVFSRAIGVSSNGTVVGFEGVNPPRPGIPVRHLLFWPGSGPARSLLPLSLDWSDGAYSHSLDEQGDVFGASAATHTSLPRPTEWTCALQQSFVPDAAAGVGPTVTPRVIG